VATSNLAVSGASSPEAFHHVSGEVAFGAGVIAAGNAHTCAIVGNNGVECWGDNSSSQLGSALPGGFQPAAVAQLTSGVMWIAAGAAHTCAIVNGAAKCWGFNNDGELGNGKSGSTANSNTPVDVTGLSHGVQAITGGDLHTCAIVNGSAKCWGNNDFGQLGNGDPLNAGSSAPVSVNNLSAGVQSISAGGSHSCAVVGGSAVCWGFNGDGQLGNATMANPSPGDSNVPVQVTNLTSGVKDIATGSVHTCALVNGGVQCWGDNSLGQLGTGISSTTPSRSPVPVPTLTSGVQAITAGANHNCALLTDATVRCWGDNRFGQLGINSDMQKVATPTAITIASGALNLIVAGHQHTCTDSQGAVWCWGVNDLGEVGVDPTVNGTQRPAPTAVSGVSVSRVPFAAPLAPLHVLLESVVLLPPDLAFSTTPVIDTTALTINGVSSPYFVRQGNYAVLFASTVSLQGGSTVTGTSPLIVVANGDAVLAGFHDLRGNGTIGGPGASAVGSVGSGGDGVGARTVDGTRFGSGGGGGGYGFFGCPGGSNSMVIGGGAGTIHGGGIQDPLLGGAPGGGGGLFGGHGAGGGGGGALQVSSLTSVRVTGVINAGGGGGPGGGTGDTGGGGGGAGGEIILEAPSITVSGILAANGGGGGGGGGAGGGGSAPGTAGSPGLNSLASAPGGAAGAPQGSAGGAGGTGSTGAQTGVGTNSKDGGGGGGVGVIWLRYRAATQPNLVGSVITPASGQDATIP
jgi:alpha-tubulin suppressor-like RCC1 family protein